MLTKNLLYQICSELTGVSLLFKVKQNGFKLLFASKEFLDWGEKNFEIQENEILGLSLNQIIKLKKLPYFKGNELKTDLSKVVDEKITVNIGTSYLDLDNKVLLISNIPLIDDEGHVGHILHQINFIDPSEISDTENDIQNSSLFEGNGSLSHLFENNPFPMVILGMEGKIKSVNKTFLDEVFPLHKKNKMINEVFDIFTELNISDILNNTQKGKKNKLDLKLRKGDDNSYFVANLVSMKDDLHVVATLHNVTEIKKMRKDLVKKSMLMEDCLKFQKQDFENMEISEVLKSSLSFMLNHSDAHKGLIWVKDLAIDDKLGHQNEFLFDQSWKTHKLNLSFLFDENQKPTRNEPFNLRSNALANIGLLENSVSGFGKSIIGITGRKSDHLLFVILLQMDATKVFDLEDKYVLNIVSSCIFSELAGVLSGRMISGEDRF
ncbi:MAG: hypothetical protein EA341_02480 [Mongoliibacter sp.]|uniref:hypothetical protein n=1 Tax=Mongoliibacter sp. TaxID=2022438 RepID=UPI0012F006D6|nr:hypothetical protein [Mongoliibacter sp.]TVP52812.1 MAG: hypothetical protein EA341_02480 [Mongoliibacter sp.]